MNNFFTRSDEDEVDHSNHSDPIYYFDVRKKENDILQAEDDDAITRTPRTPLDNGEGNWFFSKEKWGNLMLQNF